MKAMKQNETRPKTTLQGRSLADNNFDKASEVLASVRRITNKDAIRLLGAYGSIKDVICAENYEEFMNIEGIAKAKIDSLTACFKAPI